MKVHHIENKFSVQTEFGILPNPLLPAERYLLIKPAISIGKAG